MTNCGEKQQEGQEETSCTTHIQYLRRQKAYPTRSATTRDVAIPFIPVQVFGAAPKWTFDVQPEISQSDILQVSVALDCPSLLFYIAIESAHRTCR